MTTIYRSLQNNKSFKDLVIDEPTFYFIFKKKWDVHIEQLNHTEFKILNLWSSDENFEDFSNKIESSLLANDPIFSEIGQFLHKLLNLNLLVIRSHENL